MLCPMNRGLFSFAVLFSDPGRYLPAILIFTDFLIQRNHDTEHSALLHPLPENYQHFFFAAFQLLT